MTWWRMAAPVDAALSAVLSDGGYFFAAVVMAAVLLDLVFGDPEWLPHPVRWMGALISALERGATARRASSAGGKRLAGAAIVVATVAASWGAGALMLWGAAKVGGYARFAIFVYIVWACLAAGSLKAEAKAVVGSLKERGIGAARLRLSRIVGRDTHALDREGVCRAAAESVAENSSDGVVAPLFYLLVGGPPLMLAYKAVNTCDSMLGYKNEKYIDLGRFAARLDDAANYLPARAAAWLMVASSWALGYDWKGAARTVASDSRNHPSPNSGFPEAAVAGATGLRFGGPSTYGGVLREKPHIGRGGATPSPEAVGAAVKIMLATTLLAAALAIFIRGAVGMLL